MAYLREVGIAPVASVIKGHEAAQELVSHDPSRPQITGRIKFRVQILWGQKPWSTL